METETSKKTHKLAVAAIMAAIAAVLQFIEFSIPIMPSFVTLDISDLPALLGAYALGPWWGLLIQLVKNLIHLLFGSSAGVGEACNFVLGSVFVVVAGLFYHRKKTRGTALLGSILGALAMALICLPLNYFLVYPAYVAILQFPMEAIIGAYEAIMGNVAHIPTSNALLNCLLIFNVPFTFAKGLLDVVIGQLIYKPLSPLLHK